MNREEITEMLASIGVSEYAVRPHSWKGNVDVFQKFAALVAAKEREACAKEAERMIMYLGGRQEAPAHDTVWHAARAIRARGQQ